MEPPPGITDEQIEEYNSHFRQAAEELEQSVRLHDRAQEGTAKETFQNLRDALNHLRRCLEIVPTSWQCMWLAGKAHQGLDEHKASLEYFEKALALEDENPDVPREASLEAMELGEAVKAETYAKEAVSRNPSDPGLIANLALTVLLNKRTDEALEIAARAVQLNPEDPISGNIVRYIGDVKSGKRPMPSKIGPKF